MVTGLVLIAGAAGLWNAATSGMYLCAISAMLYVAGYLFVRLLVELLSSESAAA